MISVSAEYQTAIKARTRRFRPKVEITWTDPTIDPSIATSATDENYVSYPDQCADTKTTPARKWAHLDGVMKADGTYYPAPSAAEATAGIQMGFWSATRCNGSKVFSSPPTLTISFAARPILGLVVVGDSVYNEYPTDFTVKIYDTDDTLMHTETVTGNAELTWRKSISEYGINDATYMVLRITKWSTANRVAKILEFYTSVVETYEGDDIAGMNLLEEREVADGSMPVGNIACNELDLDLQNIRLVRGATETVDPFFPSNPNSYLVNLIKKNRKIKAWLGLVLPDDSVEYVPLGTFWSGDWNANENSPRISTSARDRMEALRKAEFSTGSVYENVTLYDLAETVLNAAKANIPMTDLTWSIDAELADFTVPWAYFPRQDYFKCVKQIVEACMGQAYMSRDDVLIITGPSFAGNA